MQIDKKTFVIGMLTFLLILSLSNKPVIKSDTIQTPVPSITQETQPTLISAITPTVIHTVTPSPTPFIPTQIPTRIPTAIRTEPIYIAPTNPPQIPVSNTNTGFSCNCAKTCDEMISCAEAYYQLNNCGCSRRDGDNDGVPCENIC